MKLYTVDRRGSLQQGQILNLTKENPLLYNYFELPGLFDKVELQNHLLTIFPDGLSIHGWHYLTKQHTTGCHPNFNHDTSCLAEMNFEHVRKAYYDDQHSRFQSIFACNSIQDAIKFRENYGVLDNSIFEIECENFKKYDMSLISIGTQNISGSYLAHKYWKGETGTNTFWENIVKLPIEVGSKIIS